MSRFIEIILHFCVASLPVNLMQSHASNTTQTNDQIITDNGFNYQLAVTNNCLIDR